MQGTRVVYYSDSFERCLCNAVVAPDHEIAALWLSIAESYRFLLNRELREREHGTWNLQGHGEVSGLFEHRVLPRSARQRKGRGEATAT